MRFSATSLSSRTALTLSAAGLVLTLAAMPLQAQTQTPTQTQTAAEAAEPGSSIMGNVASPAPALPGKASAKDWHDTTVPTDKQITAKVTDGMLMVDGLVAKVQLNYDVHHANYLYFFIPGVGTAVVSRVEMQGATKVKDAFNGSRLMFTAEGHTFELTSRSNMTERKTSDAYVLLDTATVALDRYPMVGFGDTTRAPYVWPLSGISPKDTQAHLVAPPPLPSSVLPRTAASANPQNNVSAQR